MIDTLTDTNILLRLLDHNHPQYPAARHGTGRLQARGHRLVVTTQNLIELWAVATRPLSSNGLGLRTVEAVDAFSRIEGNYIRLPDHNDNLFREWKMLVFQHGVSGKQVHDARLVAAMRVHGITHILTFNVADFARYPGITPLHPAGIAP